MTKYPQYESWAKRMVSSSHEPSVYDWQNMPLSEMAERALAICAADNQEPTIISIFKVKEHFEKIAKVLHERYPRRTSW